MSSESSDQVVIPEGLELTKEHYKILSKESGISDEALLARGPFSISDPTELLELGFDPIQARVPGILFPIKGNRGQRVGWTYRPDEIVGKRKYENLRGDGNRLDISPSTRGLLADPTIPLIITEGIKKGDAIASHVIKSGILHAVIALGGVENWRGKNEFNGVTALADWNDVPLEYRPFGGMPVPRTVIIAFDSDWVIKKQVRSAMTRLTDYLRGKGAYVEWVTFPMPVGGKTGADDFLLKLVLTDLLALSSNALDIQGTDPFFSFPLTDLGNGERFAWYLEDRACWCEEIKSWFTWDGQRWNGKPNLNIERLAEETIRTMYERAHALPISDTDPTRDLMISHARSMEKGSKVREMIEWAKPHLEVMYERFDQDPYLLNCENGTINLKTGELQEHEPTDFITKKSPVAYDPNASLELWTQFLEDLTASQPYDAETGTPKSSKEGLLEFLQMALGYSITGLTVEEKLFMVVGKSRTGKSTIIEAVKGVLGDYAVTSDFEIFLNSKFGSGGGSGPTEGLARLAGARFVSSSEVDEGRSLALAVVKQLTGGDAISARFMYKGLFTFKPQFSLWLVANTEPLVPQDEVAMWERVLRLPFDNVVPPEKRNLSLKSVLQDPLVGGPAILKWIVDGCVKWVKAGRLMAPACVIVSTNQYRERMDPLTGFLEDACYLDPGARTSVKELMEAYVKWSKTSGEKVVLGRTAFGNAMETRGFERKKGGERAVWYWRGLGLISMSFESVGPDTFGSQMGSD